MAVIYVVDNTVLSNYARIRRPDLLERAVAPNAIIPPAVKQELDLGEALGIVPRLNWQWLPVTELNTLEQALADELRVYVHAGEAECLAVAVNRKGIILTDDRGARRQGAKRGVEISGTIGVLSVLVRNNRLPVSEADNYLAAMIAGGFHSPVRSLKELHL